MLLVGLIVLILVVVPLLLGAAALLAGVAHLVGCRPAAPRPVRPPQRATLPRPVVGLGVNRGS